MFTTVYNLTRLIDQDIQFLSEGIASGKADDNYIAEMKSLIERRFKRLTEISCNDKLILKYKKKVEEVSICVQ